MRVSLDIPSDLARRLNLLEDKLLQILELGLRELNTITGTGFTGTAEVLEFFAQLPTPEEL